MKLPFTRRHTAQFPVSRLSVGDLALLLDMIENVYEEAVGVRLSSAEFYDEYAAGKIDSPFAMCWASYYDAYRRQVHEPSTATRRALEALPDLRSLALA